MTSEILKLAAEAQTESKAYFEANGIVVTDPGLVPELIAEIERLTARAEAAEMETMEQARLNGMGAERELALMAKAERWERLFAAATGMVSIVEGIDGAMNHGVWRDERGMRLKDTPEWVSLYNNHAAMKEGR